MFASFNARAAGLRLSAEEAIDLAAAAGFEGIDLLVRDLVDSGSAPSDIRSRMDDLGLRSGAWSLPVDWREDADRFALNLKRLPALADAAATLGLNRVGTRVMTETPALPYSESACRVHYDEMFALHVDRLGKIARILGGFGMRLGLEVIGVESFRSGSGLLFLDRLVDLDPLLRALDVEVPGVVGPLVDSFHLYAAGEPIEAALTWGADRVVWVQVADLPPGAPPDRAAIRDEERGLPGENGAVPSSALLARLAAEGYDGPVTAEPLSHCRSLAGKTTEATVRAVASALRSIWPNRLGQRAPAVDRA